MSLNIGLHNSAEIKPDAANDSRNVETTRSDQGVYHKELSWEKGGIVNNTSASVHVWRDRWADGGGAVEVPPGNSMGGARGVGSDVDGLVMRDGVTYNLIGTDAEGRTTVTTTSTAQGARNLYWDDGAVVTLTNGRNGSINVTGGAHSSAF
jgi:hypothetical protein